MLALLLLLAVPAESDPAVALAIAYLSKEVPRWHRENQCFSCHNNGDAARALYAASRKGYRVPPAALVDTAKWLSLPETWGSSPGSPAFSDKKLARIQFAAALEEACAPGPLRLRSDCAVALTAASTALKDDQKADGSWQVDAPGAVGSPVTYGPYLATYLAIGVFKRLDPNGAESPPRRALRWFTAAKPVATIDRAAWMLALPQRAAEQRPALIEAQNHDGGWGPYRHTPSEAFDTSIALLALQPTDARDAVARGRAWLVKNQSAEGDWTETTRPAGAQSYAQHISTAGWATLALLATAP